MKKLFAIVLMGLVAVWLNPAFAEKGGIKGPPDHAQGPPPHVIGEPQEPVYQFLNPKGIPSPIDVQGLAPRLDTIDGKTIYVVVCEAGPQTGPPLYQYLVDHYPNTNWVHIQYDGFGPNAPTEEVLAADGVIGGQSW